MNLSRIVRLLNRIVTPNLADTWDNTGLLLEPSSPHIVKTILVTNDLTEPVFAEAKSLHADLILSYHPPIFKALKQITQAHWKERLIVGCLENRIAVYSPHTGLDAKFKGINDWLLSPFDCHSIQSILPKSGSDRYSSKCLVLKGCENVEPLLASSDAFYICDIIRNPPLSSNEHWKVELRCIGSNILNQLTDLGIPFTECPPNDCSLIEGYGRIGKLKVPMCLTDVIGCYRKLFGSDYIPVAIGADKSLTDYIKEIAVCAGSGSSVLSSPNAKTADLFVTGEMSHHDILEAVSCGISVITVGHSTSERGYLSGHLVEKLQTLFDMVTEKSANSVAVHFSKLDKEPIELI